MHREKTREILKRVRQVEVRTNRLVDDVLAGPYHSIFKGRGMDFSEVREYVPGDDVRAIDWNVTARAGRPYVKRFVEERELRVMLLFDISASNDFGSGERSKREWLAELGAALALSAERNGDKVGLILFTDRVELFVPPAKGRAHVLRILRELLFFEPEGRGTDIAAPLDYVGGVLHRRGILFLASDWLLPEHGRGRLEELLPKLRTIARRHDLVALRVRDPREQALPEVGLLTLEDAETGEVVELDTRKKRVQEAYRLEVGRRDEALARALLRSGIDLLDLRTDAPYLVPLMQFFRARQRRLIA